MLKVFLALSDLKITDLSSCIIKGRILDSGFSDPIGTACEVFCSVWEMPVFSGQMQGAGIAEEKEVA